MKLYRGIDIVTGRYVTGAKGNFLGEATIMIKGNHVVIRAGSLEKFIDGKWRKVEK